MTTQSHDDATEQMLMKTFGILPTLDDDAAIETDTERWWQERMEDAIAADWQSQADLHRAEAGYLRER